MERVIVATGIYPLNNDDMWEINNYLANGWTVKSVTTQNTKDHMTVIFVVEKSQEYFVSQYAGRYESESTWNGPKDYIELYKNGTYKPSIYGHQEGRWLANDDSITIIPNDNGPSYSCNFYLNEQGDRLIINGRLFVKKK